MIPVLLAVVCCLECTVFFYELKPYVNRVLQPVDWAAAETSLKVDQSIKPVEWAVPGTHAGLVTLNEFCLKRLRHYAKRNDPNVKALSNVSPWLHFGK